MASLLNFAVKIMIETLVTMLCLQAVAAQPALLKRRAAVSELGVIRDRLSRQDEIQGTGWGMDWSRRISPAMPRGNAPTQHHVSSASNSYGTVPSASTTSLLYSRPRQRQAIQRRILKGYRQSMNPYLRPRKRPNQLVQLSRFENSPSSSTSNGDNLPEFAYHLNKVATHRRRAESLIPSVTVYGTRVDEGPIVGEDGVLFVSDGNQNAATGIVEGAVEVAKQEGVDYPEIIVRSTLDLSPAVEVDVLPGDEGYLLNDSNREDPTQEDEAINYIDTDRVLSALRNYRGEGIPYEQILLDNAIDVEKLLINREKENMIVQQHALKDEEDTGKSLSNLGLSQSRRVQLITDSSVRPVIEDDHKVIYLKMIQPESSSRLKGTKLKDVMESNDEDVAGENSFESYIGSDARSGTDAPEHGHGPSNRFDFDLIENQIAAVNRIGDVDSAESQESTKVMTSKPSAGGPRPRLNEENSLVSNVTTESQDLVDDDDVTALQKLKNFGDVQQRSNSPANQNKQLSDYYPVPPSEVFNQVLTTTGSGYNQGVLSGTGTTITPSRPFKQRYPGWADVEPYQYSEKDPETGAYKFGYGDQYQWRREERRSDGVVFGGYGWLDEVGAQHIVRFVADRRGYRVLPQGQEINFNEIPVYPPLKESEGSLSTGGSSQGYNKVEFVTPTPLRPTDFGSYPGLTSSSTQKPGIPDFNLPQVHPPVAYPGSVLQLLGSNSGPQNLPGNLSRPGIALTFPNNSVESSTIPTSILQSLLKEQAKQSYQGRSQTDASGEQDVGPDLTQKPEVDSDSGNANAVSKLASTANLGKQNTSSDMKPPFNTASNSIAVPKIHRESSQENNSQ